MSINVIERNCSDCKYVENFTHHVGSIGAPSRRIEVPKIVNNNNNNDEKYWNAKIYLLIYTACGMWKWYH
jgi:hypothetical protein